ADTPRSKGRHPTSDNFPAQAWVAGTPRKQPSQDRASTPPPPPWVPCRRPLCPHPVLAPQPVFERVLLVLHARALPQVRRSFVRNTRHTVLLREKPRRPPQRAAPRTRDSASAES